MPLAPSGQAANITGLLLASLQVDYNLSGMSHIHLTRVKFRHPLPVEPYALKSLHDITARLRRSLDPPQSPQDPARHEPPPRSADGVAGASVSVEVSVMGIAEHSTSRTETLGGTRAVGVDGVAATPPPSSPFVMPRMHVSAGASQALPPGRHATPPSTSRLGKSPDSSGSPSLEKPSPLSAKSSPVDLTPVLYLQNNLPLGWLWPTATEDNMVDCHSRQTTCELEADGSVEGERLQCTLFYVVGLGSD